MLLAFRPTEFSIKFDEREAEQVNDTSTAGTISTARRFESENYFGLSSARQSSCVECSCAFTKRSSREASHLFVANDSSRQCVVVCRLSTCPNSSECRTCVTSIQLFLRLVVTRVRLVVEWAIASERHANHSFIFLCQLV